jgi:hypothetical protein
VTNTAWQTALRKAETDDFRFHDLRHTWASWHRQAGTSCDELKDLGGWKSRSMVDRSAKCATQNVRVAAGRIDSTRPENVTKLGHSRHGGAEHRTNEACWSLNCLAPRPGLEPGT